jgi:hypothetical protein
MNFVQVLSKLAPGGRVLAGESWQVVDWQRLKSIIAGQPTIQRPQLKNFLSLLHGQAAMVV